MRRIGDMTMLLRAYSVMRRHRTMDLNELRNALKADGVYTSAYKLWYLLGSSLAERFGIRVDGGEYSLQPEIECPVVKTYTDLPKPVPTPGKGEPIVQGPRRLPTKGKRAEHQAERAAEVLAFIKHAGRAPSQLGGKHESSLYQFMSEHRKRDPQFEEAITPFVRKRKGQPLETTPFSSMPGKTGSQDDVKLAMQLAESGGAGFM